MEPENGREERGDVLPAKPVLNSIRFRRRSQAEKTLRPGQTQITRADANVLVGVAGGRRARALHHRCMAAYARQGRNRVGPHATAWASPPSAWRKPRSPDGNASRSPAARIATYCAVHAPTPGEPAQLADQRRRGRATRRAARSTPRRPGSRPAAGGGHPELGDRRVRQRRGLGEEVGEAERVEPGDGRAVGGDQAAREAGRVRDRHLLTEDRADPDLERVDRARARAGPRRARTSGRKRGSRARCRSITSGSASRSNMPPHLRDEVHETRAVVDSARASNSDVAVGAVSHFDDARRAVEADRAPVDARVEVDVLDTRDRPRREEPEQRVPRERRAVREPQLETAVGDEARRVAAPGSQLAAA